MPAHSRKRRRRQKFRTIYQLGTDLSRSLQIEDVLQRVAESGQMLVGAERCTAMLYEPRTDRFSTARR